MKKGTMIALIVAACCVVAGLCLSAAALIGIGFDLREMSNMQPKTNTYIVNDEFSSIDIRAVEAEISLLPAEDNVCRVVCEETDKITHKATVEGSTLTIRREDSRRWYEQIFNIPFRKLSVTLYLPAEEYRDLTVQTVSGKITVSAAFGFADTALSSTSGSITCPARIVGNLTASTVSGSITLAGQSGGHVAVSTTSGKVELQDIRASAISVSSVSGDVTMTDAIATGTLQAESVSGEISLNRADGAALTLSTVSGDIDATLLSGKVFSYDTVSGHVSLPQSTEGAGSCKLHTTSGSIHITQIE